VIIFNITLCSAERRKPYSQDGLKVSKLWDFKSTVVMTARINPFYSSHFYTGIL